jgi:CelD/BcsL family acetyltransferase involved in cellulose biosynthesis
MALSVALQAAEAFAPDVWMSDLWLDTWWEHLGCGQRFVLSVPPWGEPLPLLDERRHGFRRLRRLGAISQRCSLRCAPGEEGQAVRAMAGALAARRDWEWLEVEGIVRAQGRALAKALRGAGMWAACGGAARQRYVPLDRPWGQIEADCKPRLMAEISRRERALRKLGRLELEIESAPECAARRWEECLRLEAAGWKGRAGTAMLSVPAKAGFYCALVARLAAAGMLRLGLLTLNGRVLAFNLCVGSGGGLASIKIAYDESPDWRKYGLGQMLQLLLLKWAQGQGMRELDLMGGDDATKAAWTPHFRELTRLRAANRTWRGRAAGTALRWWGGSGHHGACTLAELSAPPLP